MGVFLKSISSDWSDFGRRRLRREVTVLLGCDYGEYQRGSFRTKFRRFNRVAQDECKKPNLQTEFLAYYLAELSLLDYNCVKLLPSLVAASVIFLARFMIMPKKQPWSSTLEKCTGYKTCDLRECVLIIHDLYLSRRGDGLQAVREKYKQHKPGYDFSQRKKSVTGTEDEFCL